MASTALSLFPSKAKIPRPAQREAIEKIEAAFNKGRQFVILEAPTGTGKSHVAISIARKYGPSAYLCTLTKSLQIQYMDDPDFKPYGLRDLKGRGAYKCDRCDSTCREGGILFTGKMKCDPCPYHKAKVAALEAPIMICNYHSFLHNIARSECEPRELLILDEAHELENVIMSHVSVEIRISKIPGRFDLPLPSDRGDLDAWFAWLAELKGYLKERSSEYRTSIPQRYVACTEMIDRIRFAERVRDQEWIVDPLENGKGFDLRPVTISRFGEMFFRHADRVLLMSGTILDPGALCLSLGIDPEDAESVTVPCGFPKENRPIIAGNLDMHKDARDQSWPAMLDCIKAIMDHHADEKGLLLTPSNEMIKYIKDHLPRDHSNRLILAFGDDREEKLRSHLNGDRPTVLTASGMWEGVDLYGDRSRFQIIPAMPRPFLSHQVRARMHLHYWWYDWKTTTRMIQGIGRSIRSEADSAVTYVLDREFRTACDRQHNRLVPDWIKEAVIYQG